MATSTATTASSTAPPAAAGPGATGASKAPRWVVVGVGVVGMIWLSTTSFAPMVIAFLIAALVYQAVNGTAFERFLSWLGG